MITLTSIGSNSACWNGLQLKLTGELLTNGSSHGMTRLISGICTLRRALITAPSVTKLLVFLSTYGSLAVYLYNLPVKGYQLSP